MKLPENDIDVLCIGHASYDLVFSVSRHPLADEKIIAQQFFGCGGGPAANAAVTVSRLGFNSAFAGYLGEDLYGDMHFHELESEHVDTHLIIRGPSPTPLSTILVKPDGQRALVNYKGATSPLVAEAIKFSSLNCKVILFDGHEPHVSLPAIELARKLGIPSVLDAGSLHEGTRALMDKVDYLVCSEKFAQQFSGNAATALKHLANIAPNVVITLGEKGLIWQQKQQQGHSPAFPVNVVDTTGAGDAFHGAFAAALASGKKWLEILKYASVAGTFCCTKTGARPGLPSDKQHRAFCRKQLS